MSMRVALPLLLAALSPLATGALGRLDGLDDRLLAAHNRERTAAGLRPFAWDARLAADARAWAAELQAAGAFEHSPDDPDDPDPQGENLWAGTTGHYTPEAMVGLWAAEKRHYVPGIFPANSATGDLEDVGHYTQLMWRDTRRVGCALAHGRRGGEDILVCRYSSAGNVIGERPF